MSRDPCAVLPAPARARYALLALLAALSAPCPGLAEERDPAPVTAGEATHGPGSPSRAALWQPGDPGSRLYLRGRVIDTTGRPLAGATVQLWQADGRGAYRQDRYRATLVTAADGAFDVSTVLPGQYWGAKHIHLVVSHRGHRRLATRILFKGDPNLDLGRDDDLAILLEEVHEDGGAALLGGVELVLQPAGGD